ncbi:hypothetical protein A1O7_02663 [Cladophialophora yegresii CBS 114405]|uniref:Uncharacterized protein n=1 Tax=Cladophialophora yegresii CBS 114405 TaxID=1182544 RepID=W9WB60_9EURO|nr:uncharacterized protein A1O7_02663 [Cladophialophora yegresii CBS 114405]EXJ62230.1 hypothetical protein A1O7_02663 [Cladophialophora yegresii CBS 114405]
MYLSRHLTTDIALLNTTFLGRTISASRFQIRHIQVCTSTCFRHSPDRTTAIARTERHGDAITLAAAY